MRISSRTSSFRRLRSGGLVVERKLDKTNRTRVEVWLDESESVHSHHLGIEWANSDSVGDAVEVKGWPEYAQNEHRFARSGYGAPKKAAAEVGKRTQAVVIPLRDDESRGSGELPELPKKGEPKWPN